MTGDVVAFVMGDMDLVAPLGRAGIPCVAVVERGAPARWSRYVRRSVDTLEAWHEPGELAERLVTAARKETEAPVLFYQSDPELLMVSRFRDRLTPALRFVVAEPELVEDLVDKARFAALAQRLELDVPGTLVLEPGATLPPRTGLRFPLIVKPTLRRSEDWTPTAGSAKAVRVASSEELEAMWARFEPTGTSLIVQELLEGPESAIESYHVYVDAAGETAGEFTGRKIRTRPLSYGVSTAVEVLPLPEVRHVGREIVARIGLSGVAKLDFKRDTEGRLRLLEVNPRFNLWHYPGALAGVNLPALVFADVVGSARPPVREVATPVRWVKPWHDVLAAREAGQSLWAWGRFAASCPAKSSLAWRDPLASVATLGYGIRLRRARRTGPAASSGQAADQQKFR